jgi:protein-disulfide isomerase
MTFTKTTAILVLTAAVTVPAFAKKDKSAPATAPAATTATTPAADTRAAATVGGTVITLQELDLASASQLGKVRQQEYDIRAEVLTSLIQAQLVELEAASLKVTEADLIKSEVDAKAGKPTPQDVTNYYEQMKSRMGGKTFDDVKGDIEKMLTAQKVNERRGQYLNELSTKYQVKMLLDPPRTAIALRQGVPAVGPADAPVTIVEWSDYQCPFCKRAFPTVEAVLNEYKDKVRYIHLDYPLPFHQQAMPAAVAVHCAEDQGKFWEYNNNLYQAPGDLSKTDLTKRAADLGLDGAAFEACMAANKHEVLVKTNFDEGAAVGVTGTPAFFINGRMLVGAQPIDQFRAIINDELSRKGVSVAKASTGTN